MATYELVAGDMNNVMFGDESMGYYETIGGGAGAGPVRLSLCFSL